MAGFRAESQQGRIQSTQRAGQGPGRRESRAGFRAEREQGRVQGAQRVGQGPGHSERGAVVGRAK